MSQTAIAVENLGKKYVIRHQQPYSTLREAIATGAKSVIQRFTGCSDTNSNREDFWALKDVSFEIKPGDRLGIIGRNGAGKSTLLKVLSRITEPTTGRIKLQGRVASLLEVGTGFHPELTGRENIFLNGAILGMTKVEIKQKFDEIVDFAEIEQFLDTPVKRYSSGMYVRLAFAVAAHLEPEILIVDEVLAVGDAQFQNKCLGKMRDVGQEGRTVIFVSHNMGVMNSLCDRGIYLNSGCLKYQGDMQTTVERYLTGDRDKNSNTPGIIYQNQNDPELTPDKFQIIGISLLDVNFRLKPTTKTWDYVRIRIRYYSPRKIVNGSVVLKINTGSGIKLVEYSTSPLSGLNMTLEAGESYVDCIIPSLPLSAGRYSVGAGLAIPMMEWLCWYEDLATLQISDRDIYQSRLPPNQERTPLAIEHYWELSR